MNASERARAWASFEGSWSEFVAATRPEVKAHEKAYRKAYTQRRRKEN